VWYNMVYTQLSDVGSLYLDGELADSCSFAQNIGGTKNNYLGTRDGASVPFNGSIDEVKIYNRGLTAEEVKTLYLKRDISNDAYVSKKDIYTDSSGNVGIGTTSPGVKLDILYDGATYSATTGTADTTIRLRGGDATNEQIGIRMSDGSGGWENWFGSVETAATTGDFVFQSYTGAAYSEKMRITSGGNVGIGETSPGAKLHITTGDGLVMQWNESSSTNAGAISNVGAAQGNILFLGSNVFADSGAARVRFDPSLPAMFLQFDSRNNVNNTFLRYINDAGTESEVMMWEGDTGNVGIGTTAPQQKLHVKRDTDKHFVVRAGSDQGDGRAGVMIQGLDDTYSGNMFTIAGNPLVLNGNVGIGTTAPTHTLNVIGGVNITGDLFVQGQNMSVPDYVFEAFFEKETFMKENQGTPLADYELASISELAQYIKENKQLPPSQIQGQFALEEQSNNLVQQQYYLLEKQEEQTLYIIQLQEQLNQVKLRLQALEPPQPPQPQQTTIPAQNH